jgi:hypothetical protein
MVKIEGSHIRDLMMGNLQNISNHAMCGDSGDGLLFALPAASDCSRCMHNWMEEKQKDPVRHKVRLKMHGVINGGYSLD